MRQFQSNGHATRNGTGGNRKQTTLLEKLGRQSVEPLLGHAKRLGTVRHVSSSHNQLQRQLLLVSDCQVLIRDGGHLCTTLTRHRAWEVTHYIGNRHTKGTIETQPTASTKSKWLVRDVARTSRVTSSRNLQQGQARRTGAVHTFTVLDAAPDRSSRAGFVLPPHPLTESCRSAPWRR